jgi:3-oxoacyl-[acyl-carrier protein] reductase
VALVTGGAQGIGKEIVLLFLNHGANVIAADINGGALTKLDEFVRSATYAGGYASFLVDVAKVGDLQMVAEKGEELFGGIDILVNNAGILHSTPMEEVTEEEWDRMVNINLKSCFFASQKVLPAMKRKKWGRIIHMSSLAGRMGGYANGLGYSATKAGIIGLSRGMAYRLAPYQITVNCIAPGTTESGILSQFSDERLDELKGKIPLGRLGKTMDIAALALFLASDMASFITGSTIDINGGMYMG